MFWTEKFRINSHDCDTMGYAKPSSVLRYMQETAFLQHQNCGPTIAELRRDGKAFILSKLTMSIYSKLKAFDEITVTSWNIESKGASFNRCCRMYSKDVLVAELISVFALVDINTRRFVRVSDVELNFTPEDETVELDAPARLHIPDDVSLALNGEYTVYHSLCDENCHMNNTNYIDMFCNFIPDITEKRVATCSVSYQSEAELGCVLKVYRALDDEGIYYFKTVKPDGSINAISRIVLE